MFTHGTAISHIYIAKFLASPPGPAFIYTGHWLALAGYTTEPDPFQTSSDLVGQIYLIV